MRIAHVITRLILGGAQENTVLSCEGLMRAYGEEVLLVTGPALGPEGSLLERARGGRVPLVVLPQLRREIHAWRDVSSYRAIKRVLRSFRPDVVHTHSAKAGLLGRMAATSLGVPAIVHTVHGAPFHPYQGRGGRALFRLCERYAARRCDVLVSVADAMTELLVAARVAPREKFVTIYSGIEVEPFLAANKHRERVRRKLGYTDEHIVVGKIARLFELKGHEYVIAAARAVVAQNPRVRFLLVGDGALAGALRESVARADLARYFHFAGLVAPEQIPDMIGAKDIVVHASLREGLARVLPQALVAGKPVVSYDIDGAREVVIPDVTGFLLPPRSIEPLAAAVLALAADARLRERLGAEGRRRFTDTFRHEEMTRQLHELYERLLAAKTEGRK
jgi:glycosyltransferase involved in cell wall biosynthesis